MAPDMAEPSNYSTGMPAMTWEFPKFLLETTFDWDYSMCGDIMYRVSINGREVDETTTPIKFEMQNRRIIVET